MVAFLRPENPSRPSHSAPADPGSPAGRHLRLVVDNTGSDRSDSTSRSTLSGPLAGFDRLVDRLAASPIVGSGLGSGPAVALAAALIVGALLAVRVAQGQPPDQDWAGTVAAASPSVGGELVAAGPDDLIVVAAPGDSLWSIAERYAPGHDRRDAIDTLADLNGGSTVQVGQKIVIPRDLLD